MLTSTAKRIRDQDKVALLQALTFPVDLPDSNVDTICHLPTITGMNSETIATNIDLQILADHEAVMRHVNEGTPVEPELARRVRERSERLTEEIRSRHGDVDVNALIRAVRDEE